MPKTKISEFSATPANNTDIDSINISEGCAPSGINDAIRELMAQLKDFQVGSAGDPVTVGGVLTVQAGSASTPALTTAGDTNTGMFFPAADTIAFAEGGAEVARFDSSGNLGLGVTPSAWFTSNNLKAFQLGGGSLVSYLNNQVWLSSNYYLNASGADTYVGTGAANRLIMDGAYKFFTAPSGTAGNAITFTQAMTLTSDANLLIGTSDASMYDTNGGSNVGPTYYKFILTGGGTSQAYGFTVSNGGSDAAMGLWGLNSASKRLRIAGILGQYTSNTAGSEASVMTFSTMGSGVLTERARIDSSGNFSIGTTGTAGGVLTIGGGIGPSSDNVSSCGNSSRRWSVVYAGTGTINTSDAREKTAVRSLTASEITASQQLANELGAYKWLSAVAEKGNSAREHIGMTVQRAIEIMEANGLTPFNYGFICYNEWADKFSKDADGNDVLETPAGSLYSFRMDELTMFIARGQQAIIETLTQRIATLEAK